MEKLIDEINHLKLNIQAEVIDNAQKIEEFRIKYLGTKGILKNLMIFLKDIPIHQKPQAGQILNDFKFMVEEKYKTLKESFSQEPEPLQQFDYSLPGTPFKLGSKHPLRIVLDDLTLIFNKMGFSIEEGPEIEDDWHNFESMNLPEFHPARDMQDTFYIKKSTDVTQNVLLRTHTSNTQARIMEKHKPPIRVACPGRVYRNEAVSARSHCFFHQIELLYIDKHVSFVDLKQTLYYFVKEYFGDDVNIRFRPSYFPFTEPSAEMDISCIICNAQGCNICKHTGWVEILGSGMVHPKVLQNFHIDPELYTGFAAGMGLERIAQLKYQVNDLRLYSQNDIRFLKQFSSL
ncbi:MAG: phenylalanine--tRNA ligase subunit alpha [Alphaproteobacteria bacterium]|nr:phenylalanine--tRNA ligase subunit alpha [Alphaproteobacteria bacterium]